MFFEWVGEICAFSVIGFGRGRDEIGIRMDPNIKIKIDELLQPSDLIIASPETIDKLQNEGLPFQQIPSKTIDELFEERKQIAMGVLNQLPTWPNQIISPEMESLYKEVRECILFGLNGDAITLSGNLIEFALKYVTFVKESGRYLNYDPDKWDSFEQIKFLPAIDRAKRAGLVSSEIAKRLHAFRKDIRNPYSHYNIRKITQDVMAEKVKTLNIFTGEQKETDIAAKDDPNIQAVAKPWVDEQNVLYVFHFADEMVKYLFERLEQVLHRSIS